MLCVLSVAGGCIRIVGFVGRGLCGTWLHYEVMNMNRPSTIFRTYRAGKGAPAPSAGATPEEWLEDSTGQAGHAKDAKGFFDTQMTRIRDAPYSIIR